MYDQNFGFVSISQHGNKFLTGSGYHFCKTTDFSMITLGLNQEVKEYGPVGAVSITTTLFLAFSTI